ERQGRSVEGSAKSHGGSWLGSETRQNQTGEVLLICHGNFAGPADRCVVGRGRLFRAVFSSPHRGTPGPVLTSVPPLLASPHQPPMVRRLGPFDGRLWLAAVGVGRAGRSDQRHLDTLAVSIV